MYRLFTKNCITRMEILLVSSLMYVIFHISPGLLLNRSEFNNTLLCQNEGVGIATRTLTSLSLILLEFRHSSPPLCKNNKKLDVDKKIQACETLTLTKGFVFSSRRCSKQSVSRLLTLNWSEHFIRCG